MHKNDIILKAQNHINQLAQTLNTKVVQKKNMPGMMYVEYNPPMIEGPLLDQEDNIRFPSWQTRCMTVLHELGHVFWGHTQGRPPFTNKTFYFTNGVLDSEAKAWNFALIQYEMANLPKLTSATRLHMWSKLDSYYKGFLRQAGKPHRLTNGNRHYVEFVYDEPTEYFWSIKEKILGY